MCVCSIRELTEKEKESVRKRAGGGGRLVRARGERLVAKAIRVSRQIGSREKRKRRKGQKEKSVKSLVFKL